MILSPDEEKVYATLRELVTVALDNPEDVKVPGYMAGVLTDENVAIYGLAANMIVSVLLGWSEAVGIPASVLWRLELLKEANDT